MSLVFAALVPHPPILIPTIGKAETKKVAATTQALRRLEEELYLSKPNLVIIISPHGELLADAFTINFCTEYKTDLREFGDLTTKNKYIGDSDLANAIREKSKLADFKTVMTSAPVLDHGASVPLYFLMPHLPACPILPLGFSGASLKTHLDFGNIIKDKIIKSNKRIAVIASGDMSHALASDAPAGFHKDGAVFDAKIRELLTSNNIPGIVSLDEALISNAAECGLRSLVILLGVLRDVNFSTTIHAYEAPFGVGYLTAQFSIF